MYWWCVWGGLCSSLKRSSVLKKGLLVLTKVPSRFCLGDYLLDREAPVEGKLCGGVSEYRSQSMKKLHVSHRPRAEKLSF